MGGYGSATGALGPAPESGPRPLLASHSPLLSAFGQTGETGGGGPAFPGIPSCVKTGPYFNSLLTCWGCQGKETTPSPRHLLPWLLCPAVYEMKGEGRGKNHSSLAGLLPGLPALHSSAGRSDPILLDPALSHTLYSPEYPGTALSSLDTWDACGRGKPQTGDLTQSSPLTRKGRLQLTSWGPPLAWGSEPTSRDFRLLTVVDSNSSWPASTVLEGEGSSGQNTQKQAGVSIWGWRR